MQNSQDDDDLIVKSIFESLQERIDFFNKHYLLLSIPMREMQNKSFLKTSESQVCRFCGKRYPDVSFKMDAHAIPEFIGNKILRSTYECNKCNHDKFSRLENELANYLKLERTVAKIVGKDGYPVYKTNDKRSRIYIESDQIRINSPVDDDFIELKEEENRLILNGTRGPYTPRLVFKCLTKMALSIIPEEEIGYFGYTLRWLNNQELTSEPETNLFQCWYAFTPGPSPPSFLELGLLKRRDDNTSLPYMLFYIAVKNFFFQIFLPFCEKDLHLEGGLMKITHPARRNPMKSSSPFCAEGLHTGRIC